MWSDEQLSDAVGVLMNSADEAGVQRVEDVIEDGSKETYLVIGDVTYTDPLYIEALEKLVKDGRFKETDNKDGRAVFRKA
jgi:hypothetical protein